MKFDRKILAILDEALAHLEKGFAELPDVSSSVDYDALSTVIRQTAEKLQDNYPYFHPLYAGQMLKPSHPVARLAYMLALWINPNNHALDGGRASSHMEKEAVAALAGMFGWDTFLGHLCGGGTMANLEALWIAGKCRPGLNILASEQAHYTHQRISDVLKLTFQPVMCDSNARMNLKELELLLRKGNVGTVVATCGTTATGSIDPLPEIIRLKDEYGFRLHLDAAYGGYFNLADNLTDYARQSFACIGKADSIVIDPHKHGLQPYGCGCVMFKDPAVGKYYKHDSPYTYFSSSDLHLGEISLECSRPGAAAVALWATQKLLPMTRDGEFARGLSQCRSAAVRLCRKLSNDPRFLTIMEPELDIVVWTPMGKTSSEISGKSIDFFNRAAQNNLHLAVFKYPSRLLQQIWPDVLFDTDSVSCLRACLMKPEHEDWLERIWDCINAIAQ